MIDVNTGHVIIVTIAVVCGLIMLKVTKKIVGIAIIVGLIAAVTKYFGIW